ncbi:TPA: hypothetical protein ACX1S2_002659 [Yersinia enterocolitica]
MIYKTLLAGVIAILLAGCSSQAERIAACEAQGVSRDCSAAIFFA